MLKIFKYIGALLCVACSSTCNAATDINGDNNQPCNNSITTLIGNNLGVNDFSPIASACKRWPKDKSMIIAAYAYDSGVEVEYKKSLIVALVDTNKNKVAAIYKGKIQEDSISTVDSLRIDTARYDVAPGVRAFGVDVKLSVDIRCAGGGSGPMRTLYVQEGDSINPILIEHPISRWVYHGGTSPCDDEYEGPEYTENVAFTIGISKEITNGYYNLAISELTSYSNSGKTESKTYEYCYDGKRYVEKNLLLRGKKPNGAGK
ncbi:MAG TPA: hypothetical protein VIU93_06030 [Gallionellaceae bacterium]